MCDLFLTNSFILLIPCFYYGNIFEVILFMENKKNVPDWVLNSTTGIEKNDDAAALVIASFIGALRKRDFTEKEIGIVLAKAFLLPLEEVEKRIDKILSLREDGDEGAKKLCLFLIDKGVLFDTDNTNPVEITEILEKTYGKEAAFETLLTYPKILSFWKNESVRDEEKYAEEKRQAEIILHECSSVFPEL